MSEALENKAVELLDKGGAALGQFSDKLVELTKQYGPDVVDGALSLARVEAAQNLIYGIAGAVICYLAARRVPGLFATGKELHDHYMKPSTSHNDASCSNSVNCYALGIVLTIVGVIALLVATTNLLDVWTWVGIFEPKLWLAKKVLGL